MGNGALKALGINLGTAVVNAGIQQGQNAMNSRRSYKYGIKAARETADIQNRQTEFNMNLQQNMQKEMWDYTNYENQKKHLEEAGLNPALMYGISGGGGATTGGSLPTGSGGNSANGATQSSSQGMGIESILATKAQLELLQAQKENIQADTQNKQAQTPNTQADTENKKTQHGVLQAQAQNIAEDTIKKVQEIEALAIQNKINKATVNDQIKEIKAHAIGEILRNALTKQETKSGAQSVEESKKKIQLMDRQINNLIQEIMIKWKLAGTDQQKMEILRDAQLFDEEFNIEDILKGIGIILPTPGKGAPNPVKGFQRK